MPTATAQTRYLGSANVAGYSVAVFRIVFGLLGTYGIVRFVAKGWVETLYLAPEHHLTYQYFDWVHPWPTLWMYGHVIVVGVAALCVALGFHSRLAAGVYLLSFGYLELIDGSLYLNHYWWMTLAAAWLVVLDVHNVWSVDVWRGRLQHRSSVRVMNVWILRAQLGVVYVFAGLAKLNPDWVLDGNPLGIWLASRNDVPFVGVWLDAPAVGLLASWAGLLFDCTIVGWLLWPRSRRFGYIAVVVFHAITGMLFQIGLFPLVMIAGTLVFFDPDWPLRLLRRGRSLPAVSGGSASDLSVSDRSASGSGVLSSRAAPLSLWLLGALLAVAVAQVAVPLRHIASPGNVRWSEEGYYLSWRVMLTEKTGTLQFVVTDPASGEVWRVHPESVLTPWQARQASIRSDLLLHTAHLIAEDFANSGHVAVEVRANSFVSFNGRPRQRYADAAVDLAELSRGTPTHRWLHSLEDPVYD